jgi:hypothetical protein
MSNVRGCIEHLLILLVGGALGVWAAIAWMPQLLAEHGMFWAVLTCFIGAWVFILGLIVGLMVAHALAPMAVMHLTMLFIAFSCAGTTTAVLVVIKSLT